MVNYPHEVEAVCRAVFTGIPDDTKDDGYGAAMACEAAFPGHEDFPEGLPIGHAAGRHLGGNGASEHLEERRQIVIRLIEQAVAKACAHYGADEKHIQHRVQEGLAYLFTVKEAFHYEPAQNEAAHK